MAVQLAGGATVYCSIDAVAYRNVGCDGVGLFRRRSGYGMRQYQAEETESTVGESPHDGA